ncbi:MAG: putative DNA binding domain-containing protein, partial [Candidatus Latescibacteria bacterium]|nr:putative DNA binding domain-containing protein [Candidatus Latescibacterota bacterium]
NTNDGTILVGVSDSKDLVGTSLKMENQIASVAHSCKPSIFPKIKAVEVEGKTVLVVTVRKTGSIHSSRNIAYKRVGSHDQPLSPGEVIELAKRADRIMFDDQICRQATLEHISEEKVRWFLRKAKGERNLDVDPQISLEEALEKLGLIIDGKLTNAAVLVFGKDPQRYFVQSEVRCARFKGTKAVKPFIDMKVMDGAVYQQID